MAGTAATFNDLGLAEPICDAAATLKWKAPTQIQKETIPLALTGKDVIGLAETGSGKTGAFVMPILHHLLNDARPLYALIIAPTRELAIQIHETVEALGRPMAVKSAVVMGGVDRVAQALALSKRPHIIVATPGRIIDHLENTKGFSLKHLKFLVMDEADKMLNMDFEEEIDKLLKIIPRERTTFLFSATMTSKVQKLQRASLRDPIKVEVSSKYKTVDTLVQNYMFIPAKYKEIYLTYAVNELAGNSIIIFASTCAGVQKTALILQHLGFPAVPLHGQMTQAKRIGALQRFKSLSKSVLIATDVASRGLDIPHVDIVINYDVPANSKDYIHRVGRTARAGRSGRSITMVTQYDVELLQKIEHVVGKKMTAFPTEEDEVMLLQERVGEAQRYATLEMKEKGVNNKRKRGGNEDMGAIAAKRLDKHKKGKGRN
eukprot:Clim_evm76s109 gene=Clim_evmTU76s109